MDVLKFGGSSIGRPENVKKISGILNGAEPKIVVLSAFQGTTDHLINLVDHVQQYQIPEAENLLHILKKDHIGILDGIFAGTEFFDRARTVLEGLYDQIRDAMIPGAIKDNGNIIIVMGEYISTHIFHLYLESQGIQAILLNALEFMRMDRDREPDMMYINENLERLICRHPQQQLFITQGFVCKNYEGTIDHWGRGGSDYSASLIGAALRAREIQIWTDTDGIHTNDPRFVQETQTVHELSYKEAAELAYFGAKVLHPKSVFPAQQHQIPLRIKNTMNPDHSGTLISSVSVPDQIKSVAAKDGIIALRIRSGRMLMAYGFLKKVFQVFEDFKTPIDMISTSEVSVSLTIDEAKNLDPILIALKHFGEVEYDLDQTIVCIVGDFLAEKTGLASRIMNALKEIPIRMICYGGSMNNISILIRSSDKQNALNALHQNIFLHHKENHAVIESHTSF